MAGPITTGNHPKALWPGVMQWWGTAYNEHKVEYTQLFDTKSSDKNYEELVQDTPFGLVPVKAQGAGVTYDYNTQGPTTRIIHVAYALGYIVTHEELQDNLYMEVSSIRAPALARAFRQTKERIASNVYHRAFNGSYTGGDGVSLCSTAHPNTFGGTFQNKMTVDADLSEAAIEDMLILIDKATDDRGNLIGLNGKSLHVAPDNRFNSARIMKSPYQPGNSNNDINVIYATNSLPEGIQVNHYFTSAAPWFIRTDVPKNQGMLHLERETISFTKDNDFDTMNAKAKGYERYSFGWGDPRAVYGSNAP